MYHISNCHISITSHEMVRKNGVGMQMSAKEIKLIYTILFAFLILLTGCYSNRVFNEKGELTEKTSLIKPARHKSYTKDKKLVKGFFLNTINDTIEKRCFNYIEIEYLKKVLKESKIKVTNIVITKSSFLKYSNCIGVFYLCLDIDTKSNYKMIPLLNFEDKFAINTSYIEGTPLLQDTINVMQNINDFKIKYKSQFKDSTMMDILNAYKYGIILQKKYFYR
ncbi:MAG: hypothetical protein HXX18_09325 [Bacteroidetes bacterium]|nr:hypothetical protein [Bacteroidota bacterium]